MIKVVDFGMYETDYFCHKKSVIGNEKLLSGGWLQKVLRMVFTLKLLMWSVYRIMVHQHKIDLIMIYIYIDR